MPRSRRAARRGPGSARAGSPASEEEAGSEVLSHCSSASEGASPAEEGAGSEAAGEQGQEEEAEDRLKEHMDNLLDKSAKTRQVALQSLRLAFSSKTLSEFLLERRLTLTDSLEKCLKKGKGEEQALAGTVLALLCLQMGSGPEGEEVFRSLKPLLVSVLTDSAASPSARQSCATALGMCCYIAAADVEDLISCLSCLEGIFSPPSTGEGDSAPVQHGPLHCSALQSWSLLLTICPPSHIKSVLDNRWLKLPPLLSSSSVALRILAGETIALVFELAQDLEVRQGAAAAAGGLVPPRYRVPVCPAQGPGYREQQVSSQDRPTETALHLPGHLALHRERGVPGGDHPIWPGVHVPGQLGTPVDLPSLQRGAGLWHSPPPPEQRAATGDLRPRAPLGAGCDCSESQQGLPLREAPLQLGCLQSPHESPEPGAGQAGGCAVTGGGGAEPPAHLDCRPSTVRGGCPRPRAFICVQQSI